LLAFIPCALFVVFWFAFREDKKSHPIYWPRICPVIDNPEPVSSYMSRKVLSRINKKKAKT
jgi:hypothetical protein